jgi:hypothetical protein
MCIEKNTQLSQNGVSPTNKYKELNKTQTNCSSSSPLAKARLPLRDATEVALHRADDAPVFSLCAGLTADISGEAAQQDEQGAAAAQQLQELSVLNRHPCERALRQHGPQQRVVLHTTHSHTIKYAAAAEDEKSRCGTER